MGYCTKCGAELKDGQSFCTQCGKPVNELTSNVSSNVNDDGGFLWGLLGFCVPVAGLILYLVWQTERPLSARAAGKGALISVILNVIFVIIYIIAMIALAASGAFIFEPGVGY